MPTRHVVGSTIPKINQLLPHSTARNSYQIGNPINPVAILYGVNQLAETLHISNLQSAEATLIHYLRLLEDKSPGRTDMIKDTINGIEYIEGATTFLLLLFHHLQIAEQHACLVGKMNHGLIIDNRELKKELARLSALNQALMQDRDVPVF